jgi:hypothetical protein
MYSPAGDDDHVRDALLFQLKVEIGVCKPALAPVLLNDDIAFLRYKVRMPFSAPRTPGEGMALPHEALSRIRMIPVVVVTGLPAAMRGVDNPRGAKVVEQSDVCGNVVEHRKELAAIREKVVIRVD